MNSLGKVCQFWYYQFGEASLKNIKYSETDAIRNDTNKLKKVFVALVDEQRWYLLSHLKQTAKAQDLNMYNGNNCMWKENMHMIIIIIVSLIKLALYK